MILDFVLITVALLFHSIVISDVNYIFTYAYVLLIAKTCTLHESELTASQSAFLLKTKL
jgi:hypothetical protein